MINLHERMLPLYSNAKRIAFWRNACIVHDTGLEFCQAAVSYIKCIVHMYILTGEIYTMYAQLTINQSVQLISVYQLALIV